MVDDLLRSDAVRWKQRRRSFSDLLAEDRRTQDDADQHK